MATISPTSPTSPAPLPPAGARSPQRGNWPYTSTPPARTTEAAYQQIMANVPDRTLPKSQAFADVPDRVAQWVVYGRDDAAYGCQLMQKGLSTPKRLEDFTYNATQVSSYANLAAPGLDTWLRTSPQKSNVVRRLLDAGRVVSELAGRMDAPQRDKYDTPDARNRSMADALRTYVSASDDALRLLQRAGEVRERPLG